MQWLISANSSIYDHASSFEHYGSIDWRQGSYNYSQGDIVFIYCTRPAKKIRYKCQVEKVGLSFEDIRDDEPYWLDKSEYEKALTGKFFRLKLLDSKDLESLSLEKLLENGLKAAPQGAKKLSGELLNYINAKFSDDAENADFPETIISTQDVYEGLKKTVSVNRYERSSLARKQCIEANGGYICKVCDFDFEEVYGELGKSFIHVHHIVPIHKIDKEYKVDYKKDLIPVCPNCHAMLHRQLNGNYLTHEELRLMIQLQTRS